VFARFIPAALLALALVPGAALAKVRVAASTTDLASIATSVGGDKIEVFAIARPNSDPHRVEALPSYMIKVSRAQVFLKVGLGLDQWADAIIDGSRNDKVLAVDCSQGVNVLEKPAGKVDASMGDVHPNGNPHYWLDPRNGAIVAKNVAEGLARVDPANADEYRAHAETFGKECNAAWSRDSSIAVGIKPRAILTYHRSWSYLGDAFDLEIPATIEPVPGIPPTARHLADLVALVKGRKLGLLLQEPYFSADAGQFLGRNTGVRVITRGSACDNETAGSYLAHIADIVGALAGTAGGK
jgi:zinc/manganese transport system substrate-binding protein